MKCARELIEMKKKAVDQWNKEARQDVFHLSTMAIEFCELVSKLLEKQALERKPLEVYVKLAFETNKYGHLAACTLQEDKYIYANGEKSYSPNEDFYFDYDVAKYHFEKHCIKIDSIASSFKMYGSGDCPCKKIRFYVPANHEC